MDVARRTVAKYRDMLNIPRVLKEEEMLTLINYYQMVKDCFFKNEDKFFIFLL